MSTRSIDLNRFAKNLITRNDTENQDIKGEWRTVPAQMKIVFMVIWNKSRIDSVYFRIVSTIWCRR